METNEIFRRLAENDSDILRLADRSSYECEWGMLRFG
jgi:hypothetical protein